MLGGVSFLPNNGKLYPIFYPKDPPVLEHSVFFAFSRWEELHKGQHGILNSAKL